MGYSAKVGSFNIDTSKTVGQTQVIAGLGFQPKLVLFWWSGSTGNVDTVAGGNVSAGFGAASDSVSQGCVCYISNDASASSNSYYAQYVDETIAVYSTAGTYDGLLSLASMDADGFTLLVDDQFANAYRISYLALGGDDLANVSIGFGIAPTSTGNKDFTGVGFQPDALIVFAAWPSGTSGGGGAVDGRLSLGFATGAANQGVADIYSRSAQAAMETAGYGYSGEIAVRNGTGDTLSTRAAFVSFDADGFTLNFLEGTTARNFMYVALKGGQYSVGALTTRTDGNDIAVTAPGFQPIALLLTSANRALSTQDTPTAHASLSIGAATSPTNRACAAIWDEDALANSETAYANSDTAAYANVKDDAIQGLMDLKSMDADGFTAVMDDADPGACWVAYLAIGAAPVANLAPADAAHAQTADNVSLIVSLAVADANQAQTAENVTLTQTHYIVVEAAGQAQAADNVTLTPSLTVADASQAQTAEGIALTQTHNIVVEAASQAQAADEIALTQTPNITAQAAYQTQAAQVITLTQTHYIIVGAAHQAQIADRVVISNPTRDLWNIAAQAHGFTTTALDYATDDPILPGLALFAISRALYQAGIVTSPGQPADDNAEAWAEAITS